MTETLFSAYRKDVNKHCKYLSQELFNHFLHISLQYNYVYTVTPKAACSTIKSTLQKIELGEDKVTNSFSHGLHNRFYSPLLTPSQVGGFERFLDKNNPFKFCFVRNPYTRLLSAYLDKFIISQDIAIVNNILETLNLPKCDETTFPNISFATFIYAVEQQDIAKMNAHWRIQYYQTFQDTIEYTFIGRFENFESDFSYVLSKLIPNYSSYYSVEQSHRTNANELLQKYYTPELIEIVQDKFAIDFEYFNYSKNIEDYI